MKLLHFSDVHIGVESYGFTDDATGLNSRLMDFLHTFDQVVEFAINNKVDAVLFAGDAYKSRDPSQTHQREFARRIAYLSDQGVPTFLLLGNHDLPHIASRATALDIFNTLSVPNITIGDGLETYKLDTKSGPLQVISLPWIRRSSFLAREEARNLSIDQVNQEIQKRVTSLVENEIRLLDQSVPAVLVAHISLNTAKTSSEQSMMLGRDPILMQSTLASTSLDYVALGHIHKHQVLSKNPYVVYSGSLERVDFGEENDEKGFCVLEIDPSLPSGKRLRDFTFHKVNARRFLTIEVEAKTGEDPTVETLKEINRSHFREAIVRVKITMPQEIETLFREDEVRLALSEAKLVTPIVRQIQREARTRLGDLKIKELSPKEALRKYLQSTKVKPSRMKELLMYGEALIKDEFEPD